MKILKEGQARCIEDTYYGLWAGQSYRFLLVQLRGLSSPHMRVFPDAGLIDYVSFGPVDFAKHFEVLSAQNIPSLEVV